MLPIVLVPSSTRPQTIAFLQKTNDDQSASSSMTFAFGDTGTEPQFGSVVLDDPVFADVPFFELGAKVVISSFNELFIGDLAFLAMLIGMNNSSGAHCLMCLSKGADFNCPHADTMAQLRTKASLVECLEKYMLLWSDPSKKGPPNYKGVNCSGLLDIDPQRIIIPILHCPMGLIDKVLESFKHWVNLEVEDFGDNELEAIRSIYKIAKQQHESAIDAHKQAQALALANPTYAQAKVMEKDTDKARLKARKAEAKAKEVYDEQVQRHNAKKSSLNQQFEEVYRYNGVKREHYHGGKFNGVNCIRIMSRSQEIVLGQDDYKGFLQKCIDSKVHWAKEEDIHSKCLEYSRLLGLLDAIWSTVRGIDAGLLPTEDQKKSLEAALKEAKALWLLMKLSTRQPKWHLTFDGHLLQQFQTYGGLADKSDETIEKGHQTLKTLRERFRGISSYETRETCIRRELRRARSPEIQKIIDNYNNMIKHDAGTKRANESADRQDNMKKAKEEKRQAYIDH
jgi:hypothetical protein